MNPCLTVGIVGVILLLRPHARTQPQLLSPFKRLTVLLGPKINCVLRLLLRLGVGCFGSWPPPLVQTEFSTLPADGATDRLLKDLAWIGNLAHGSPVDGAVIPLRLFGLLLAAVLLVPPGASGLLTHHQSFVVELTRI